MKNPFPKILPVFFLGVIIAGCAVRSIHNETYVSAEIAGRTGHELRPEDAAAGPGLPEGIVLEDGLTEDEAVAVALWNNAQFQADLAELGFARADLIGAGMLRNPIFSLLFPLGPKQLEATLSLPFDFLWQRPKRVAAARLNAEKTADSLVQHGLDLVRDVMIAYAELELARDQARIAGDEAILRREMAEIASDRLRFGDISGLEESAFRLRAAQAWDASVGYSRDAELAEKRLQTLLGLGLDDTPVVLSPAKPAVEIIQPPDVLVDAAFAARPDLRAVEIAIEAAGERLGWEKSRVLNLTAMLDANGEGKEGFEMGPGLQLELPIFNQNNAQISRAQTELLRAARQYLALKYRIAQHVREAHAHLLAAQNALRILEQDAVPTALRAADNAKEAYEVGEISYLELLDFQSRLLASRLREAEAKADLRRAEVGLEHSVGFKLPGE